MLTHVTIEDFREAGISEAYKLEEYTTISSELIAEAYNTPIVSIYASEIEPLTIDEELDATFAFIKGFIDGARHIALRPAHPAITLDPQDGTMLIRGRNIKADEAIAQKLLAW